MKTRTIVLLAVALAIPVPARAADRPTLADNPADWIALLQSGAPKAEKAKALKALAVFGNRDAVPALAAYLSDEELSSWARIALEAIPDPACDEALRKAMAGLKGRLLVGVINSIGVRGDAKAADALGARLGDPDVEVAKAAAAALGRIAGATAVKALEQALDRGAPAIRGEVADALVRCAEKARAAGRQDEAIRLYDLVSKADVPQNRAMEGVRGAIVARGPAGLPLLAELLKSSDKKRFALALKITREVSEAGVTDILLAELERATPARQAPLLAALADRADPKARDVLLRAAAHGGSEARVASIRGLTKLSDRACGPALLDAVLDEHARVSEAATEALADLPGKEIDALVVARLQSTTGKPRLVLIELVGRRHIEGATTILLKLADDPDAAIRAPALTALGSTIGVEDLPLLIARAVAPRQPEESKAAEAALGAACARMPDREASAAKVLEAMVSAPVAGKGALLGVLAVIGGDKGLKAVGAAAKDANPEIRRAAYRALGQWPTAAAGPALLDLAVSGDPELRTGALRGYIRIARQFNIPDRPRMAMFREIVAIAQRDEERRLALDILKQIRTPESLSTAIGYLGQPSLRDAAAAVAVTISEKLAVSNPDAVAAAMQQVIQAAGNKGLSEKARVLLNRTGKK